jgi:hypothetical protein
MHNWSDFYLQHFTRILHKPFDVEVYRKDDGTSLRLATFDSLKNYRTYASLGISDYADQVKDVGEIILLADDKGKDIRELFVNFLFFILERRIPLGSHFVIGGVEKMKPDFAEYFDKQAIYFTLADEFPEVVRDGHIGMVYQGIFISWAEHDYLNRKGWQEFEDRFHLQRKVDKAAEFPFSLRRPSCV